MRLDLVCEVRHPAVLRTGGVRRVEEPGKPKQPWPGAARRRRAGLLTFAGAWLFFACFYGALASDLSLPELGAGVVAAGITALFFAVLARELLSPCRFRWRWLPPLAGRLATGSVRDVLALTVAAFRPMGLPRSVERASSDLVSVPFDRASEECPGEASARRALVAFGFCFCPNTFAVTLERSPSRVLVHQMVGGPSQPGRSDALWPI